jgi:cyclopropane-fatty-acyl-phospholipid synthase
MRIFENMSFHSESKAFPPAQPTAVERFGALVLRTMIGSVGAGRIIIVTPSSKRIEHRGNRPGPEAVLVMRNWRALRRLLTGALAFADSYVDGDWTSPDLAALIEFASRNIELRDRLVQRRPLVTAINRVRHFLKTNTRSGSRRNIAFHYDLGNDFYRLWLDPGMTYSSALYDDVPGRALEEAQAAKLDRIVHLLDLQGGENVLEIGCGWGALALRLAQLGLHVTGITLSTEQLAHAKAAAIDSGLTEQVAFRLQDYRDVDGRFDRIVSIEMIEAVGEAYWPAYFQTLRDRLRPGGKAVLQVITIDEKRFENYRRTVDFIQRHIFPGGMLPSKTILAEHVARAGLSMTSVETFGASYARTLAEWRHRFLAAWPDIEALGFTASFKRVWEYYLCYCEAGFRTGAIDVGLYVLADK